MFLELFWNLQLILHHHWRDNWNFQIWSFCFYQHMLLSKNFQSLWDCKAVWHSRVLERHSSLLDDKNPETSILSLIINLTLCSSFIFIFLLLNKENVSMRRFNPKWRLNDLFGTSYFVDDEEKLQNINIHCLVSILPIIPDIPQRKSPKQNCFRST